MDAGISNPRPRFVRSQRVGLPPIQLQDASGISDPSSRQDTGVVYKLLVAQWLEHPIGDDER